MRTCDATPLDGDRGRRRFVLAAALAACLLVVPAVGASQPPRAAETSSQTATEQEDPERAAVPAPVTIGGEPVIWIAARMGPYSPQQRADRISQRLEEAVHNRTLAGLTIVVTESGGASELRLGWRLLMVVTQRDAEGLGASRDTLAEHYARELDAAIRAERLRYTPATLMRSGSYGLLATLLFAGVVWLIHRVTRTLGGVLERRLARRAAALGGAGGKILDGDRLGRTLHRLVRTVRVVLVLAGFNLYLTLVLGLFPWTRPASLKLLDYVLVPVRAVAAALIGYLPNLLFVIVIGTIVYWAIRLVGLFFRQIGEGRLEFNSFPAEWADPTNKIARVLLVAFGLVVAFPYLPASNSPAFAGVSVFVGVLVSLASSSALSNMIAGIVLTYTGAFRLGDRVKLGEALGDIIETSLLATHIRTIKNEHITIPNSIALSIAVTNFSRPGNTLGLILHTSVTIGYDAPWRKVHDLLVEAALGTPGVLPEPRPFVWQTALNDFYVTYEINAYTASPRDMIDIYAALHARIQDSFHAAGVEIMSPHYTSLRDGNTVAIPDAFRAPGYRAPAFRVEDTPPVVDALSPRRG